MNEPRTMQFVIERMCEEMLDKYPELRSEWAEVTFPIVVWVNLPGEGKDDVPHADYVCSSRLFYRVAQGRVASLKAGYAPAVCEHMGGLCE